MASPKVSLQQRRYQGRWNMRPPSDGQFPREILNIQRLNVRRLLRNMQTCEVCSVRKLMDWRSIRQLVSTKMKYHQSKHGNKNYSGK
uniref:Uncharacterized protein n=1 Tax=Arundo donax TaxID=35708 RepID=A0A0A9EB97_ARUDO